MRCDDVRAELDARARLDTPALADHLSNCADCASHQTQLDRLHGLWDATRPADPSLAAFDALWAEVVARAEAPEPASFSWKRFGLGVAAMAQAAALLVAGGYVLMRPAPVAASVHDYQVEGGTTLLVKLDDRGAISDVVVRPLGDDADMAMADLDVLNFMESRSEEVP